MGHRVNREYHRYAGCVGSQGGGDDESLRAAGRGQEGSAQHVDPVSHDNVFRSQRTDVRCSESTDRSVPDCIRVSSAGLCGCRKDHRRRWLRFARRVPEKKPQRVPSTQPSGVLCVSPILLRGSGWRGFGTSLLAEQGLQQRLSGRLQVLGHVPDDNAQRASPQRLVLGNRHVVPTAPGSG